jgi:hypothetical protein
MKSEELLKNISNLLKKHENFLNNNPELFHAIESRLLKAINDEDEDSDYDWTNIGAGEQEDEDEDGSGYGDDLFDKVPSDDTDDEDERYIRGDAEADDEDGDDEASRWLREHGEDDGESDESGYDFDPDAARESDDEPTNDIDEDANVQQKIPSKEEPKKSSSRYVDWKPKDKYEPEHQKAIDQYMKDGYSHREAERLAGAHSAPSDFYSALRSGTKPSEPSPKMLEQLKSHAHEWLRNADRKQMEAAEAENNPQKHATGKAIAAHEEAHKDFETAHNAFLNSDELKGLTGRARHQAIQAWKKDWSEKNPEHREKAVAAANSGKAFAEANEARKQKRAEGEQAILDSGKSFGHDMTSEFSNEASGGGDGPMSAQAAGQSVGGEQNEEGGFSTNIKKDPAAVFAERNPEYVKHLQSKLNPQQAQRLSGIDSLKVKGTK